MSIIIIITSLSTAHFMPANTFGCIYYSEIPRSVLLWVCIKNIEQYLYRMHTLCVRIYVVTHLCVRGAQKTGINKLQIKRGLLVIILQFMFIYNYSLFASAPHRNANINIRPRSRTDQLPVAAEYSYMYIFIQFRLLKDI